MNRKHGISFKHAWDGLAHAVNTQPNFMIHITSSILIIVAGIMFQISGLEWIILALTIAVGLVIELVNTAAAAMLVYALGAIVVAAIIFLPKIWLFI